MEVWNEVLLQSLGISYTVQLYHLLFYDQVLQ